MTPRNFVSTVIKKEKFGTRFFIIELKLNDPPLLDFIAGQYISVDVGEGFRRAYSIASSPSERDTLELCIDYDTTGPGGVFFRNLKIGTIVNFMAPLGSFTLPEETFLDTPYYFLATGSGVAPVKSQVLALYEKTPAAKAVLYFGTKFEEDILYKDLFTQLSEKHPTFKYVVTVSRPRNTWQGASEYIPALLERDASKIENAEIFICGSSPMMQAVLGFLKTKKVSQTKIHLEKFSI